ncbi:hypothetical protein M569_14963, partial [Genlisea aurea]
MAFRIPGLHRKNKITEVSLLMERLDTHDEHAIDIVGNSAASSSSSSRERLTGGLEEQSNEFQPSSSSAAVPPYQIPRNTSLARRGNSRGRQRSPLNSVVWISVELLLTASQIIAAVSVLSLSRDEKPHTPLRTWIAGYASGCCGILPLLYWRFKHRNLGSEQDPSLLHIDSSQRNGNAGAFGRRVGEGEDSSAAIRGTAPPNPRLKAFFEYLKMALDCFFAVWFVVGNVWIFGDHSSSAEAPNLYRLCIIFLAFSCIGYAMPFILCTAICCCFPCLISMMGIREDFSHNRGATQESIDSLPAYNFKANKNGNPSSGKEASAAAASSGGGSNNDFGIVGIGTDKERSISDEDAVCCICLSRYVDNDELRELPCCHFFHRECVDKWLRMNASCPLCKGEVGDTLLSSLVEATANMRNGT